MSQEPKRPDNIIIVRSSFRYLAREIKTGLLIAFEADCYDDAIAICRQEGWLYAGWRDENDSDK